MTLQESSAAPMAAPVPFARVMPVVESFWRITVASIVVGSIALGLSYVVKPTFTARATFLPPQQTQGGASAALAQLGSLANFVGGGALRTQIDQYVAFVQTDQVLDHVIDHFQLTEVYGQPLHVDARRILGQRLHVTAGKKDGLITIEVDDKDPRRAAAMVNEFLVELKATTNNIAVTDAQQRRVFFEREMKAAHDQLSNAEDALQRSGISRGALNAQPAVAGTAYSRTNEAIAAAEVKLQVARQRFADGSPEIQSQEAAIAALRAQLSKLEASGPGSNDEYINRYREFKYRETLFELFAKQYEIARVDEAREGALIQVVDPAQVPEKKSKPRRSMVALLTTLLTFITLSAWTSVRATIRENRERDPAFAAQWDHLKHALRRW